MLTGCDLPFDVSLPSRWSEKIWTLSEKLCEGKELLGGRPIVILADKDKEEMDSEIESFGIDLRGSSITCRNGDPLIKEDLLKVSAQHASAIIILANEGTPEHSDAHVIHIIFTLLALDKELKEQGSHGLHVSAFLAVGDVRAKALLLYGLRGK